MYRGNNTPLLTHTYASLRLEIQDRSEPEITALAVLVILRMFDPSTASKSIHTSEDVFVQVESFETPPRVVMKIAFKKSGWP